MTEVELLEALSLAAPSEAPENARTVEELVTMLGVSDNVLHDRIRKLHRTGRVQVHQVQRPNITGKIVWKPAYTFLPARP